MRVVKSRVERVRRAACALAAAFAFGAGDAALAQGPPAAAAHAQASAPTRALLQYLQRLHERTSRRVLAGQNIGHAGEDLVAAHDKYFGALRRATEQAPAILGVDYGYGHVPPQGMAQANQLLIRHWREGGLVTISMSPGNPYTGGGLRERTTGGAHPQDLVTKGTEAYRRWHDMLDSVAVALAQLRDAGVVVLWRPLHEMNGDFFWWSAGRDGGWARPADFRALWRDMFDYLSREKGLDNLLWVYAPVYQSNDGVQPVLHYYPGDDVVDVVGLDYYENTMDRMDLGGSYRTLVALGKPFAITEVGPAFWLGAHPRGRFDTRTVIEGIRSKYPATTYFVFWQGWNSMLLNVRMGLVENQYARELLNDPWVIPLGKVGRDLPR
jgi:mannan endo-1,4-beta-mannosidase